MLEFRCRASHAVYASDQAARQTALRNRAALPDARFKHKAGIAAAHDEPSFPCNQTYDSATTCRWISGRQRIGARSLAHHDRAGAYTGLVIIDRMLAGMQVVSASVTRARSRAVLSITSKIR